MSLTITISPDVEAAIRADAQVQGHTSSDVANDTLRAQYLVPLQAASPTRAGQAALAEQRHTLEEADARHQKKYGLPDISHLTQDELSAYAAQALSAADPDKVAEAERLGLI